MFLVPKFFRIIEVEGHSLIFIEKEQGCKKTRACIADLGHHGKEDF